MLVKHDNLYDANADVSFMVFSRDALKKMISARGRVRVSSASGAGFLSYRIACIMGGRTGLFTHLIRVDRLHGWFLACCGFVVLLISSFVSSMESSVSQQAAVGFSWSMEVCVYAVISSWHRT